MSGRYLGLIAAALAVFASGVAVGQQERGNKFDKYLTQSHVSEMDISLLFANLEAVRMNLPSSYRVPAITFDTKTRKFIVKRLVSTLSENSRELNSMAGADLLPLQANIPEIRDSDVVWHFFESNLDRESTADYRNGILVFR